MILKPNNSRKDVTHPTALAYLAKVLPHKHFETEFYTPDGVIDYIAESKRGKLFIYELKTADDPRNIDEFINQIKRYNKYANKLSPNWESYLVGTGRFLESIDNILDIVHRLPSTIGLAGLYFDEKRHEVPAFCVYKKSEGHKALSKKQILKKAMNNSWNDVYSLQGIRELKSHYERES